MRTLYLAPDQPSRRLNAFERGEGVLLCAAPIVAHGDIEGGVLLTGSEHDAVPNAETARAVSIAAAFLARWMEE